MRWKALSPWWSSEADHSPLQQAPPPDCRRLRPTPEDEPLGPSLWLQSSEVEAAAFNQAGAATWLRDAATPPATSTLNGASASCQSERSSRQPKTERVRIQRTVLSFHLKQQRIVTNQLLGSGIEGVTQ